MFGICRPMFNYASKFQFAFGVRVAQFSKANLCYSMAEFSVQNARSQLTKTTR